MIHIPTIEIEGKPQSLFMDRHTIMKELGISSKIVNVNGGAVGLGHPLAATGSRLVLTLALELKRSGGKYGIATACIGGGQGIALIIESM